ncbi:MAG: hypothetical protein R3175_09630 [Marinobacter sp.]|uniref:hypothetical protein n=1 Tax=Marinobacter sp. TaxID=50741 RepID=UPI00299E2967|nr:hypothetical protein [Marinobacter sp.]MDX1756306.1 hypothetical protein [Marinobacter sp.]
MKTLVPLFISTILAFGATPALAMDGRADRIAEATSHPHKIADSVEEAARLVK